MRERSGLGVREAVIHLESDPSLRVLGTRVAAKIVFACGEKDGWSFAECAVVEHRLPRADAGAGERLNQAAALNADPGIDGRGNQGRIERFARERGGGKRQGGL